MTFWERVKLLDKSGYHLAQCFPENPDGTMHKGICRDSAKLTLPEFDSRPISTTEVRHGYIYEMCFIGTGMKWKAWKSSISKHKKENPPA